MLTTGLFQEQIEDGFTIKLIGALWKIDLKCQISPLVKYRPICFPSALTNSLPNYLIGRVCQHR